ncbi:MAG: S8 family serine peptidase [Burkholderiales bacterium]|nr:S8 family serine peptidase [Burkholderiales bacterium]
MSPLAIGIVDSGVNPWHSHVRGAVSGCRIFVGPGGELREDGDFRDLVGHGTAVAGVIRGAFPDAELFAVRVFDADGATWPSLVARGILRAAAQGCEFINLSLGVAPGPGSRAVADACAAALDAGCVIVASEHPGRTDWLPASLPGVHAVRADDSLDADSVTECGERRLAASGRPRDLPDLPREANLDGHSFACARALIHLAKRRADAVSRSA